MIDTEQMKRAAVSSGAATLDIGDELLTLAAAVVRQASIDAGRGDADAAAWLREVRSGRARRWRRSSSVLV